MKAPPLKAAHVDPPAAGWRQRLFGSLQGQLSLAAFACVFVGFTAASVFTLAINQRGLMHQHEEIHSMLSVPLRSKLVLMASDPTREQMKQMREALDRLSSPTHLFWVERSDGSLLIPRNAFAMVPEGLVDQAMAAETSPRFSLHITDLFGWKNQRLVTLAGRSYLTHAQHESADGSRLWVADDISANIRYLQHLLLGMVVVWTLCLAITMLAIILLTRRIIQPLRDLNRMAASVTSESLATSHLELDRAPMEVQELARGYNSLLDRLALAWTQQRDFVGLVSHELRNPLMIISGYLRRLQRRGQNLEPEQMRALATTEAETHRITRMLNDLLDLSRSESGQLQMVLTPVAVDEVLTTACDLARSQLSRPLDLHLPKDVAEGPIEAVAETDRLQQVILNLIENADKYSPPGKPITLELEREGEGLCISVCDQGIGIASEDVPKVFDRFHRGRNAMEHERGSGLGLSVVKLLVEAMGGSIDLDSELNGGSRFHIHLPAAQ